MTLPDVANRAAAALAYVERGWLTFPVHSARDGRCSCGHGDCTSPGKHPRTPSGLKDASTDPKVIESWWRRWPDANVAVVTGEASGMVVLDVDGALGDATLEDLERTYGRLPETTKAVTGGDGFHFLFAHPGEPIRNNAGTKLGHGLDIRGDGGYIVVAPSVHVSGKTYEWLQLGDMVAMPDWLLARLRAPAPAAAPPTRRVARLDSGGTAYGLEAMARELGVLGSTGQGGRNIQLNGSAFALGQLVGGGQLEEGLVRSELRNVALSIGLGEIETEASIESGLESGKLQPRAPEPRRHLAAVASGDPWPGDDDAPPPEGPDGPDTGSGPASQLNRTDVGNALRLVRDHGRDLRHCEQWGTWLTWDARRWKRDETGEVYRRAKDTVRRMFAKAVMADEAVRKPLVKWSLDSESARAIEAMVRMARSELPIAISSSDLDADPWLLNCENGTIDLRTGALRAHCGGDLITRLIPVRYDPEAKAPRWETFLDQVFAGDADLIRFVQRAVGYTLTGDVREQVLFFLYGSGANGKTTLTTTLQALVGDYGAQTEPELLMARYGDVHPTGVAELVGKRMAMATEVEQGRRLAESLVKQLTGGDRIKARFMRQDFFEFQPSHKLWVAGNHKPVVRGTDIGIWRRLRLIPFNVTFQGSDDDKSLGERLTGELSGILNWAIRGCLDWQAHGLEAPAGVVAATADYRGEMDTVGQFLEECCDLGERTWVLASELRRAYVEWCGEQGEKPETQKVLGGVLTERGFERAKTGPTRRWAWHGLELATAARHEKNPSEPIEPISHDDSLRARA